MKELVKFKVAREGGDAEFVFVSPSRGTIKEGEMVYARHYAECLRNKLLTNSEALAQDKQRGGILTLEEKDAFLEVIKQMVAKEEALKGTEIQEEKDKITGELKELRDSYSRYKSVQDSIFNVTAETKARDQLIFHYALAMTQKDGKNFFEGKDYDARMNFFENNSQDKFFQGVYSRAVWYATAYVSGIDDYSAIPYPG